MKKKLFIGVLFLLSIQFTFCRPVDVKEALGIAQKFCQQNNGMMKSSQPVDLSLAYVCTDKGSLQTRSTCSDAYYYVFNKSDKQGFVIISGESRTPSAVLGYTDSGEYTEDNQPDNFKAWMEAYKEAIKNIVFVPEFPEQRNSHPDSNINYASSVAPLLEGISWNQGEPYNILCPMDDIQHKLSVTGCVATAMAQIMRYHKWPERGIGVKSYTTTTLGMKLLVDFSQSVYDWDSMTETYSANSSDIEKQAVALLMRDCGMAADMDYSAYGSGANLNGIVVAMTKHFNYDDDMQFYQREYYTITQWENLLKEELNGKRPVCYIGSNNNAGHVFVCDGYDVNNLFHINWGWGGISNGYFDVRTLHPGLQGIGGSTGGFSFEQSILTNIQKPDGISDSKARLLVTNPLISSVDETAKSVPFDIRMGLSNGEVYNIDPEFGLALYQDGTLKQLLAQSSFPSPLSILSDCDDISLSIKIPDDVIDGIYLIYPVYRMKGSETWKRAYGRVGALDYLSVVVVGNKVTLGYLDSILKLEPTSGKGIEVIGKFYQGKTGRVSLDIKNVGVAEYTGSIIVALQDLNDQNLLGQVAYGEISMQPGESTKMEMSGKIMASPGTYNLIILYDKYRNYGIHALTETPLQVTVYPTPDPAKLSLTQKIRLDKRSFAQFEELVVNANLENKGGEFCDKLTVFIYPYIGDYAIDYIDKYVFIDINQTANIAFKKQIGFPPGKYIIGLFYLDQNGDYCAPSPSSYSSVNFTVTPSTGISNESTNSFTIYPNPVKDIIYIRPEENIKNLSILSVSGEQLMVLHPESSATIEVSVSDLVKGMYLLRIETEKGINTRKFIKE